LFNENDPPRLPFPPKKATEKDRLDLGLWKIQVTFETEFFIKK